MRHYWIVILTAAALAALSALATPTGAWKNGPPKNKMTNSAKDCLAIPYSTHDWIVDHARDLLPPAERAWLDPHRKLLLIGTEAPDYNKIRIACGTPNSGYADTGRGRHDLRFNGAGKVTYDRPAVRAQEEFEKAAAAYRSGEHGFAAYYLGAAAHYIGDLSAYGHAMKGESHHRDFEEWVGSLTSRFAGGVFERYIRLDGLEPRPAYDAVIRTGRMTRYGPSPVIPPTGIDRIFDPAAPNDPGLLASIGHTLNKSVNETADMLHKFYITVVKSGDAEK